MPFKSLSAALLAVVAMSFAAPAIAQEPAAAPPATETATAPAAPLESAPPGETTTENVKNEAGKVLDETKDNVEKIAEKVDQDERAKEATAGLLTFIYKVAEKLSFPAFHWVAFALMVSGVVSYAFQLVLGKLALLFRGSLNITEILSDAKVFIISAVGLVLTTQAAAENSTFTQSPAAVLSATAVGAIVGLLFYRWGQRQEVEAAIGRKTAAVVTTGGPRSTRLN